MAWVIILLLIVVFLLLFLGYVWQAIDVEEFPSEELPTWFVQRVRKPLMILMQRHSLEFPLDFEHSSFRESRGRKSIKGEPPSGPQTS
jgi:hypothetical protein